MEMPKGLDWEVLYFAVLALFSFFAIFFQSQYPSELIVMPILTYIVLSLFILIAFLIAAPVFTMIEAFVEKNPMDMQYGVIGVAAGTPLILCMIVPYKIFEVLPPGTKEAFFSPFGLLILAITFVQIYNNPPGAIKIFDKLNAKSLPRFKKFANRLLSACLPGIAATFVFGLLFNIFLGLLLCIFAAYLLLKRVFWKILKKLTFKSVALTLAVWAATTFTIIGLGLVLGIFLCISAGEFLLHIPSAKAVSILAMLTYALFAYAKAKRIPAWYFSS